jgi:hypothetical protein
MVPPTYHAFFSGCASVAGTLIGLLFVAISVSPHKDVGARAPLSFQVDAGVAFTTLLDALIVALVALLPNNDPADTMMILACAGISSTIGLTIIALQNWPARRHMWGLAILPVLGLLYVVQLLNGLDLSQQPADRDPIRRQAILLIVFFMIGIYRAWQMMGSRNAHAVAVLGRLVVRDADDEDGHGASPEPSPPGPLPGPAAGRVSHQTLPSNRQ